MKKTRQTFTIPADVYQRFAAVVPARKRSATITRLIEEEARRREATLAAACDAANTDIGAAELEAEMQQLEDTVLERFDRHAW